MVPTPLRERTDSIWAISMSWGRFTRPNGLPPNLLPFLLVECGRPMLITAARAPHRLGTIMVAWKDAREPARALTAAMPLLTEAEKVVVAEVVEGAPSANDAATVAAQLAWHGPRAEARTIRADSRPVAALLSSAAEACSADLVVMGSYSTGPMREEIFGGCTRVDPQSRARTRFRAVNRDL
jgi:nucleotide-binding universal stress UspA family protein